MWLDNSLTPAYDEGIAPAVTACGLTVIRVDRVEHVNVINDEILSGIRRARCVIADFSGQRQSVYFEAGFALGLDRKVIWTCSRGDLGNLHFDTRQYNFIDWTDTADLRPRLEVRLRALANRVRCSESAVLVFECLARIRSSTLQRAQSRAIAAANVCSTSMYTSSATS